MKNAIDTSVGVRETDQGLCIAPGRGCEFWSLYEFLWDTPWGRFCAKCFEAEMQNFDLNLAYPYETEEVREGCETNQPV